MVTDLLCGQCLPVCNPFAAIGVSRAFAQGTRVSWRLQPDFSDPPPHTFTLFFGYGLQAGADGWAPVGDPAVDVYAAYDYTLRDRGVVTRARYKVRLETANGTYESEPVDALGLADERSRLQIKEVRRRHTLKYKREKGTPGFLFKQRTAGAACDVCRDPQTGEPANPRCPRCYGTGFVCGFYRPAECIWSLFEPRSRRTDLDERRNVVEQEQVTAKLIVVDLVETGDLFVDARDDSRFEVKKVTELVSVRRIPVIAQIDFQPVPFSSILYELPVPRDLYEA